MKKLISFAVLILFFTAAVFGQNIKSAGIKDKDVKNYAKNFEKIVYELEKINDSIDNEKKALSESEKILKKYGISGPNRLEKITTIDKCLSPAFMELEIMKDPETAELLKMIGMDPLVGIKSEIEKSVHEKDYRIVLENIELFKKLFDSLDDEKLSWEDIEEEN